MYAVSACVVRKRISKQNWWCEVWLSRAPNPLRLPDDWFLTIAKQTEKIPLHLCRAPCAIVDFLSNAPPCHYPICLLCKQGILKPEVEWGELGNQGGASWFKRKTQNHRGNVWKVRGSWRTRRWHSLVWWWYFVDKYSGSYLDVLLWLCSVLANFDQDDHGS